MNSLQNRLSTGLILSLLVLLFAQWWLSSKAIEHLLENQLLDQLQQDSEVLLAGVEFDRQGKLAINHSRLAPAYQQPYSGSYFALQRPSETRYSRSLWDAPFQVPETQGEAGHRSRATGPDKQTLLVYTRTYQKDNQQFSIAMARDMTALLNNLLNYKIANAGFCALLLLALVLIQRAIVVKTLKPLKKLRDNLARLQQGDIAQLEFSGPDEVKPLIDELNRLLGAIEQRLKRSREGMGNLAHALKTRLARLSQLSDETDRADLSREVQALSQEIARLIDRETARVRVVGDIRPGKRIALHEILSAVANSCTMLYKDKYLQFRIDVPQHIKLLGDREDLYELLGNLLDNASKWATRHIQVKLQGNTLIVSDDGPGCSETALNELTLRGFRADESTPGSGLGLAIVQDIASSYGAVLEFKAPGQLNGLEVLLTFKPGTLT